MLDGFEPRRVVFAGTRIDPLIGRDPELIGRLPDVEEFTVRRCIRRFKAGNTPVPAQIANVVVGKTVTVCGCWKYFKT